MWSCHTITSNVYFMDQTHNFMDHYVITWKLWCKICQRRRLRLQNQISLSSFHFWSSRPSHLRFDLESPHDWGWWIVVVAVSVCCERVRLFSMNWIAGLLRIRLVLFSIHPFNWKVRVLSLPLWSVIYPTPFPCLFPSFDLFFRLLWAHH